MRNCHTNLGRVVAVIAAIGLLGACGSSTSSSSGAPSTGNAKTKTTGFKDATLKISAIPDQDPATLTRLYGQVATSLAQKLDGSVWCWGSNFSEQAGQPMGGTVLKPKQVEGIGEVVQLAVFLIFLFHR